MKRLIHSTAVLALLIASSSALRTEAVAQTGAAAGSSQQAMLTTYCYTCHNTKAKMGGLALQGLDIQAVGADAEIWEKAMRKLRGRLMPPPGSPQPEQKDIDAFVAWMESKLDNNRQAGPKSRLPWCRTTYDNNNLSGSRIFESIRDDSRVMAVPVMASGTGTPRASSSVGATSGNVT